MSGQSPTDLNNVASDPLNIYSKASIGGTTVSTQPALDTPQNVFIVYRWLHYSTERLKTSNIRSQICDNCKTAFKWSTALSLDHHFDCNYPSVETLSRMTLNTINYHQQTARKWKFLYIAWVAPNWVTGSTGLSLSPGSLEEWIILWLFRTYELLCTRNNNLEANCVQPLQTSTTP